MATGKAVNLRVRPVKSVDLCYPVDGIVMFQPDPLLGTVVQAFDIEDLYRRLGEVSGDRSRLLWDSESIRSAIQPHAVSALRAEPARADLDQAVGMRENAYITTYSDAVVEVARQVYFDNPSDQSSVVCNLISNLESDTGVMHGTLNNLYIQDGLWGNAIKKARTDTTFSSVLENPVGGGLSTTILRPVTRNLWGTTIVSHRLRMTSDTAGHGSVNGKSTLQPSGRRRCASGPI